LSLQVVREHDIQPHPGTIRSQDPDVHASGELLLHRPVAYPLIAACLTCDQPVQIRQWFRGNWEHIEPEAGVRSETAV
jgi:hypothetical protein